MAMSGELRSCLENVDGPDIGQCEHAPGRLRWLDHVAEVAVRHLTAHKSNILQAGHAYVGDEHRPTVEVTCILLAQQAGANPASSLIVFGHRPRSYTSWCYCTRNRPVNVGSGLGIARW